MTLTVEPDLDRVKMNDRARISVSVVISFERYRPDTHTRTHRQTHTRPNAPPGPVERSVNYRPKLSSGTLRYDTKRNIYSALKAEQWSA